MNALRHSVLGWTTSGYFDESRSATEFLFYLIVRVIVDADWSMNEMFSPTIAMDEVWARTRRIQMKFEEYCIMTWRYFVSVKS